MFRTIFLFFIFITSTVYADFSTEGKFGRILRGKEEHHFETLNLDPTRKLIFLIGEDGLVQLQGKTGYEMLMAIGYPIAYIEHLVHSGFQFKIILFDQTVPIALATWENTLALAIEAYPELADDLFRHQEALKSLEFEEYERIAGYRFRDIDKIGRSDELYMTYERYLKSNRSLLDTRAFLYFTVRLNELYSGDGYTYDDDGNRCLREYIALASILDELKHYLLVNIVVDLPSYAIK